VRTKRNNVSRLDAARDQTQQLGVFRARELVASGYSREYLRRLVRKAHVRQLGRGLYASTSFDGDQHQALVLAAKRAPGGVVCLFSALQFHNIGTQSPRQVWIALRRGTKGPSTDGPPLKFFRFSGKAFAFGIEEHALVGGKIRVYSAAKTVADCFKYRHKYGLDVAVEALRDGWSDRKFTMRDITAAATVCRVSKVMQPYLEMLA
jgi:predicted transcriptional regulator of viral defense system